MSDGEVNELIATLERSNLRRTAAVFKERFDALAADNERLTRERNEIYENAVELEVQRKQLREQLAAAQQRLAALAVDPAKREELVAKCYDRFEAAYHAGDGGRHWHSWTTGFRNGFIHAVEHAFALGRTSIPGAPELEQQIAELSEATKRLAELTKPANEIELREIAWANYGAIYAQQKGEPLEPYESSTPERRARIDKAADAVAARVRGPLVQQIAELTEKLAAAERTAKAANDGREHAVRNQDRLAAELSTAKQALADARGDVERPDSQPAPRAITPAKARETLSQAFMENADYAWSWHCNIACCAIDEGVDHVRANRIAQRFMKLAFGVVTKEPASSVDDSAAPSPALANPAASEPADSLHTPETAHTSSSQSETAERRFVCPECGGEDHYELESNPPVVVCGMGSSGGRSDGCNWRGSWAEVEAAKGDGADSQPLRRPLTFALDLGFEASGLELVTVNDREFVPSEQLATAIQAREAAEQRAEQLQKQLDETTAGGQRLAQLHSELEAPWCDKHLDNLPNECPECRAERAEGREAALQSKLNDLEASRTVLKRDAELRKLKAACQMVKDYYTLGGDAFEAKYPVRSAEGRWRPCFMDIVDQALAQGEQCGEGQHGR